MQKIVAGDHQASERRLLQLPHPRDIWEVLNLLFFDWSVPWCTKLEGLILFAICFAYIAWPLDLSALIMLPDPTIIGFLDDGTLLVLVVNCFIRTAYQARAEQQNQRELVEISGASDV